VGGRFKVGVLGGGGARRRWAWRGGVGGCGGVGGGVFCWGRRLIDEAQYSWSFSFFFEFPASSSDLSELRSCFFNTFGLFSPN
jgi:hypothetical protein